MTSSPANPQPFLRLRNVNVARGENVVMHDVNLDIADGEHVVILGPNGCGKSTLIKTITCECYPLIVPGVEVSIFGRARWDLSQLRKHLGIVSADLPGERTPVTRGREAVVAGFFSASSLWPNLTVEPGMWERADEALARMEATHLAGKLVGEMSAGEKRRVMIARALVHRPGMLLLDEPSNALDISSQADLRKTVRELAREGTGILLVTHHLPDIIPEINRVIMMRQGRVVRDGSREELLTAEAMSELFNSPVHVAEHEGYLHSW